VVIDSSTDRNLAPLGMLRATESHDAIVTCANGTQTKSNVRGEVPYEIICKRNPSNTFAFVAEVWGLDGTGGAVMPRLSTARLVDAGVEIVLEKGNSHVDFAKMGGPVIYMNANCKLYFKMPQLDDSWTEVPGGRETKSAQAVEKKHARAAWTDRRGKAQGRGSHAGTQQHGMQPRFAARSFERNG
jgi:hypothetical protein